MSPFCRTSSDISCFESAGDDAAAPTSAAIAASLGERSSRLSCPSSRFRLLFPSCSPENRSLINCEVLIVGIWISDMAAFTDESPSDAYSKKLCAEA